MTEYNLQIVNDATQKKLAEQKRINKEANDRRERYRHKAFTLMIKIALILGIPAFLGLYFGKKIDTTHSSGHLYASIFLALAFILSWTIIIIIYIRFNREVKKIDAEIKKMKEESKEKT